MVYEEKTGKSITKGQQDVSLCKYLLVICGKSFHALRLVSSLLKMAAGVAGGGGAWILAQLTSHSCYGVTNKANNILSRKRTNHLTPEGQLIPRLGQGKVRQRRECLILLESKHFLQSDGEEEEGHKNQPEGQIWDNATKIMSDNMTVQNMSNSKNPRTNIGIKKKKKKEEGKGRRKALLSRRMPTNKCRRKDRNRKITIL